MKNYRYSLFSILIFISFLGFGQSNKLEVQLEGGPSLITVYGGFYPDVKPIIKGFSGGLYLNYHINKRFSIKSGISYERKGFGDSFYATLANGQAFGVLESSRTFDYLILPLLIRTNFGNKIRYFLNGGPYIGYLTSQQSEINLPNSPTITGVKFTDRKFDLGISTGLGSSFPLNELFSISVEARNNLAIISLVNGATINTNSTNFIFGITYFIK